MTTESREFLVECVKNQSRRINKEGRALIESLCEEYGVPFKRTLCQQCYHDAALLILMEVRKREERVRERIEVRPGVDVYYNNHRINDTIVTTAEECERLLAMGASREYFIFHHAD